MIWESRCDGPKNGRDRTKTATKYLAAVLDDVWPSLSLTSTFPNRPFSCLLDRPCVRFLLVSQFPVLPRACPRLAERTRLMPARFMRHALCRHALCGALYAHALCARSMRHTPFHPPLARARLAIVAGSGGRGGVDAARLKVGEEAEQDRGKEPVNPRQPPIPAPKAPQFPVTASNVSRGTENSLQGRENLLPRSFRLVAQKSQKAGAPKHQKGVDIEARYFMASVKR